MATQTFTSSQVWVVPAGVTKIDKITVIGGGGSSGYNMTRIEASKGRIEGHGGSGEAGKIVTLTNVSVSSGQMIQAIVGDGGAPGKKEYLVWQGNHRYIVNSPGGTSSFGDFVSAAGGRAGENGENTYSGEEVFILGKDGVSYNPSNGTSYGAGGVPPAQDYKAASGAAGVVIIEYGQGAVTPQPPADPSADISDMPDINGDPRYILSRFRQIANAMDKLCAELWGIGKIFNNPVISIGGRYRLPIPDSMKSTRLAYEGWATAMTQGSTSGLIAEQPLTVNGMNNVIGVFNLINQTSRTSCLDIGGTIGNALVDPVRPEEIATWRFLQQMRAKFALYKSYVRAHDSWFSGNLCARSCQVTCQTACQTACQGCNNSTCHNQNCGGFS